MPGNPIDLTTVALVKQFLPGPSGSADDLEIQAIVTACSQYALDFCGRASLNTSADYTEIRNGNGGYRMYVRNAPIISLASVTVNGSGVPLSSGYNSPGAAVDDGGESIVISPSSNGVAIVQAIGWHGPPLFTHGIRNVQLVYTGGYTQTPADLQEACTRVVAQQYMRRQTIDQQSKSNAAGGGSLNVRYRDWWAEPWAERVLWKYRRIALVT